RHTDSVCVGIYGREGAPAVKRDVADDMRQIPRVVAGGAHRYLARASLGGDLNDQSPRCTFRKLERPKQREIIDLDGARVLTGAESCPREFDKGRARQECHAILDLVLR